MKKIFIFMLFFGCMAINVQAQLKHYFSCNTTTYANFFFKEKDKTKYNKNLGFSYKIEKEKHGLEAYYIHIYRNHKTAYGETKIGDVTDIIYRTVGINYHYKFLQLRHLELNAIGGFNASWNSYSYLVAWTVSPPWYEPHDDGEGEFTIGMQTGLNINMPIWKGIYANSNIRYTLNPLANFDAFRQNMMIELGIGYKLQRKTKT